VARVEVDQEPFLLGTSVTYYRVNPQVLLPEYFYLFLQSSAWQDQLKAIMAQTTRIQVSIQKQANFAVRIPPVGEQERMATRVRELLTLCDELERISPTIKTTAHVF
jgi:type I restriction enzyme, S subunit